MQIEVAFDVGGTFTDFAVSVDGVVQSGFLKIPTSTGEPATAALQGLGLLCRRLQVEPEEIGTLLHATTIATNAILERRGVRTALITTRGFRDILLIGRQKRHDTFSLQGGRPEPLLTRDQIHELSERLAADGTCLESPDEQSTRALARQLRREGYQSVAVCFLHAYVNPANERKVVQWLEDEEPELDVSASSHVSPQIREYERTNTTVANAYVRPFVRDYIDSLVHSVQRSGFAAGLHIMQSNGGLMPAQMCKDSPIHLVESGPAAGVLMCAAVGKAEGFEQILTFDMGGTTAKLGAIDKGEAAITPSFEVDLTDYRRGSGLPLNIPSVELVEIGAGGGSIANVQAGIIQVGPRSASSIPGPACYGRGGLEPTVTDANVVLGYINTEGFNAKAFELDVEAAHEAIRTHIAEPLSLTVEEAAWAIHLLATNKMGRALRSVSIERGRDPRDYAMVGFGGAGPLHAARLARQASIRRLLVPHGAGVGSAVGLLAAPQRLDVSITNIILLREEGSHQATEHIQTLFADLEMKLSVQIAAMGYEITDFNISRHVYARMAGQGFEIKVVLGPQPADTTMPSRIRQAFIDSYQNIYGAVDQAADIEVVNWGMTGSRERATGFSFERAPGTGTDAPRKSARRAYFPEMGGYVMCDVYQRTDLPIGYGVQGPALIDEDETTTVLLPGDDLVVSKGGSLLITIGEPAND